MRNQKYASVAQQQYIDQFPASFRSNDDVDLRELLKALWSGKWIIIVVTLAFLIGATMFILKQPKIYQSQSLFIVEDSFYGSNNLNERIFRPQFFSGSELKNLLLSDIGESALKLQDVTLSYKSANEIILISNTSEDPQAAFDSVTLFSNTLNRVLKINELDKVKISIKALASQSKNVPEKTKDYLDELLAQLLFKKALLEVPDSKLVRQISEPSIPTSHIKPKRTLIVVLATLFGVMLGVAIALVRFFYFRCEDD
ncbi:Wzz/FepE/Etk N-terminal domain-containing protein [Vibrio sp.]|uniref:Wzz/FepE/Etk N-terminal domain-containing protein n=1 Tax=Vibrio sp. TaxID=678 RepID=UPI0031201621